jgi:hypothetical protein
VLYRHIGVEVLRRYVCLVAEILKLGEELSMSRHRDA